MKESDFGSGVVVCLVKFTEHLDNPMWERAATGLWWLNTSPDERLNDEVQAKRYPTGDASRRMGHIRTMAIDRELDERAVISAFSLWANGASDHFYDLERHLAPQELITLADYTLELGHGDGLIG